MAAGCTVFHLSGRVVARSAFTTIPALATVAFAAIAVT